MRLRLLTLLATAAVLFTAPFASAQSFCNSTIIDQARVINSPAVIGSAAKTLINQGANVHVVTVNSASVAKYGNLAGVEAYLEQTCPSWRTNGTRSANLFVVMVSPNPPLKNMFLGSNYAGAFDIPSTYSQLSNSYFKNRQFDLGLAAAIQGTTSQAVNFQRQQFQAQQRTQQPRTYTAPTYTQVPQQTQDADSGSSHIGFWILGFLIVGLVGLTIYLLFRRGNGVDTYSTGPTSGTDTTSYDAPITGSHSRPRTYAAAAPSSTPTVIHEHHTTVIDNTRYGSGGSDMLTGVLVGEAIAGNRQPQVIVEPSSPTYVAPPTYEAPAPAPVQDAPDSSWENTAAPQQDTSFESQQETPSYTPDPDPTPDTSFSDSSSDSSFSSDSSSSDSSFSSDSSSSSDSSF